MPYPNCAQVPLLKAVARAADVGIGAELLSGVEIAPHDLIVALTTNDRDPLLGRGCRTTFPQGLPRK